MLNKKHKVVMVTGAAGGIGQAICNLFYRNEYFVIATDVLERPSSLSCDQYVQMDFLRLVNENEYANKLLAYIDELMIGRDLFLLVNNAALQCVGSINELKLNDWNASLDINLTSAFILIKYFLSKLESANGRVINISSIHAKLTKPNFIAYATSKAALSGMTKALAVELGSRVKLIAIEPGAIDTPMLLSGFSNSTEKLVELERMHPTKSIGSAVDLARLVEFIALFDSAFINGSVISFDGGMGACLHDPIR